MVKNGAVGRNINLLKKEAERRTKENKRPVTELVRVLECTVRRESPTWGIFQFHRDIRNFMICQRQ